jgi:hypothetical protein
MNGQGEQHSKAPASIAGDADVKTTYPTTFATTPSSSDSSQKKTRLLDSLAGISERTGLEKKRMDAHSTPHASRAFAQAVAAKKARHLPKLVRQ